MDVLLLSKQNRKLDILLLLVNPDVSYFCRRSRDVSLNLAK